jgi:hypothetical protein
MTSIDSRLFVLRDPSEQQIQVYDIKTFKQQRSLTVEDLSEDTSLSGLTSCVANNCVYVSDWCEDTVRKVDLSGNNQVFSWVVGGEPQGLSINTAYNLLVACFSDKTIFEYTTSGSLVRGICLKSNSLELSPIHAIQLTSDRFVVSCRNSRNKMDDVVEVDTKRGVVVSYTNQLQSTTQRAYNWPRRLSVDNNNECILVADYINNRTVILNRSLNCCAHEWNVMLVDNELQQPSCLHFDTTQNRLFVGEFSGQRRVIIFDNVL